MNNILIPSDFSVSSRNAIHYSLHLMRGRVVNFYFSIIPTYKSFEDRQTNSNSEKKECLRFAIKQEISSCQKKVEKFFPNERFKLHVLDSLESLKALKDSFSLVVLDCQVETIISFTLYQNLLKKIKAPLLFIPARTRFEPPKNVLLKLPSGIKAKLSILSPLKRFFGNQSFSLEIHKIFSGPVNIDKETIANHELRVLFGIYHPVIKIFNSKDYRLSHERPDLQKFDLQLLVLDRKNMERKISDSHFIKELSNIKVPLLIIPANENENPVDNRRSSKNRNMISSQI